MISVHASAENQIKEVHLRQIDNPQADGNQDPIIVKADYKIAPFPLVTVSSLSEFLSSDEERPETKECVGSHGIKTLGGVIVCGIFPNGRYDLIDPVHIPHNSSTSLPNIA